MLSGAGMNENRDFVEMEAENAAYAVYSDALHQALDISRIHLPSSVKEINYAIRDEGYEGPNVFINLEEKVLSDDSISIEKDGSGVST